MIKVIQFLWQRWKAKSSIVLIISLALVAENSLHAVFWGYRVFSDRSCMFSKCNKAFSNCNYVYYFGEDKHLTLDPEKDYERRYIPHELIPQRKFWTPTEEYFVANTKEILLELIDTGATEGKDDLENKLIFDASGNLKSVGIQQTPPGAPITPPRIFTSTTQTSPLPNNNSNLQPKPPSDLSSPKKPLKNNNSGLIIPLAIVFTVGIAGLYYSDCWYQCKNWLKCKWLNLLRMRNTTKPSDNKATQVEVLAKVTHVNQTTQTDVPYPENGSSQYV